VSKRARSRPTVLLSSYYYPAPTNPTRWFHAAVPMAYADSVRLAGGVPLVAPPLDDDADVAEALARADAIILVGGPDLDPQSYGQPPHPALLPLHPRRNDSDLRLTRAALASGKPVLGICGGLQAINVARGGTLHQHLPDRPELVGADDHTWKVPEGNMHPVRLDPASRLARLMGCGAGPVEVNSSHHQAVDRLGERLRAVAWSASGLVEALEGPADRPFLVATQWHPECLGVTPQGADRGDRPTAGRADQLAIFRGLVEAAGRK
jgi:gamma-glutamyl-gamma-aminobutyrate hydrolase PuuD